MGLPPSPLSDPGQQFQTKCNGLSRSNAQMEALAEATFQSHGWSNFNPQPIIGNEKNGYLYRRDVKRACW